MSREDRAYFAGFFDGEGCVHIERSELGYKLRVIVAQKRLTQLQRLESYYGGRVYTRPGDGASHWQVNGLMAYAFLADIYPWVQEKRDQVELAIEYGYRFGLGRTGGRKRTLEERADQQAMYEQMRALKR
jgi:hypothetical protein